MTNYFSKSRYIQWKFWKLCLICWCFSFLCINKTNAGFAQPTLVPADKPLDGVLVEANGFTVQVNENVGTNDGFIIAKIMFDGPGEVSLQDEHFSVKPSEQSSVWLLYQSFPLDHEAINYGIVDIILTSGGAYLGASIIIVDVNDNEPRFVRTEPDPLPVVKELECDPTAEIFKVLAVDDDVADNSSLIYEVTEAGRTTPFRINNQGSVFCTEELDYLKQTSHRLSFTFKDNREGEEPNVGTHSLTVQVEDVPNRPPEFTRPPSVRFIQEATQIGQSIFTVQARDGDYGLNWDIEYEITDANNLNLFEITNEGEVKVLNDIDAENPALLDMELLYEFTIVAKEIYDEDEYDLTPEQTETRQTTTIYIEDINDNPPRLCSANGANCEALKIYYFRIPKNHTGEVLDEPLTVKDIDYTIRYIRFRAGFAQNTPPEIAKAFAISPETGIGEETFQIVVKNLTAIDFKSEFWHDENNEPRPATFIVEFTAIDEEHPEHKATAVITGTITDAYVAAKRSGRKF